MKSNFFPFLAANTIIRFIIPVLWNIYTDFFKESRLLPWFHAMILDARSSIASYNTHSIPRSLRGFGFLIKSFCVLDFKSFFEP